MSNIQSVLQENRLFNPIEAFRKRANIAGFDQYYAQCAKANKDYPGFWAKLAQDHLIWRKLPKKSLDESQAPFYQWFADGQLNVSYNCLDRHLEQYPNKTAIIFEADDGQVTQVTYQDLFDRVCLLANGLKKLGIRRGDRVLIYLPMSIEAVVAMQACARIGAIHSVVFGGFSAKNIQERILDARAKLVITADAQKRGGKTIPLKASVDEALEGGTCRSVKHIVVYRRANNALAWNAKRDIWWHDLTRDEARYCPPTWVGAEHPLFILYTSGSTGKPKGVQHSSAGYLLGAVMSMYWVFDIQSQDIFWCTADVGWITGHSYVAYGPLAVGATQLIYEGVPTYPDAGRFWRMIQDHRVSIFYTAPTAIRSLIKAGAHLPKQYNLSSLRLLGSVGEPINPEAWMWYYQVVGGERCPIVDTWWQTETGAHMIAPLPGAIPLKPGSCTLPLPGIMATIVDEAGQPVPAGQGGILVIQRPWPAMIRTIWGDPERFQKSYYPEELGGKYYMAGDGAHRDEDGYFWIMGRIDDVLKISGHRLGTMEIESALVANPLVAEAAVVGKPHEIKGEAVVAFVVLKGARPTGEKAVEVASELKNWVAKEIGVIARPEEIRFGDNLPKTRSGKIMRRLLRTLARGEVITQDVSTLENPQILEQLRESA